MAATSCNDAQDWQLTRMGEVDLFIEWTHDGTSVPPNCRGTVDAIRWANRSLTKTFYAHVPGTRRGDAVKVIGPGESGREARRQVLDAAGLETIEDVLAVELNETPPQPGELVIP